MVSGGGDGGALEVGREEGRKEGVMAEGFTAETSGGEGDF